MLHLKFSFDEKAVSEKKIIEYYGNKNVVYCPGIGTDQPPWSNVFQIHKSLVHLPISSKFSPSNYILTIFPIQMHGRPMLTLP